MSNGHAFGRHILTLLLSQNAECGERISRGRACAIKAHSYTVLYDSEWPKCPQLTHFTMSRHVLVKCETLEKTSALIQLRKARKVLVTYCTSVKYGFIYVYSRLSTFIPVDLHVSRAPTQWQLRCRGLNESFRQKSNFATNPKCKLISQDMTEVFGGL